MQIIHEINDILADFCSLTEIVFREVWSVFSGNFHSLGGFIAHAVNGVERWKELVADDLDVSKQGESPSDPEQDR